jgi:hypothetical protein
MTFRLTAAAIVTGRVRDTSGEPVPGLQVSLLRTIYNPNGQRSLTNVGNATTDDRGEYRIFCVPPGRYFLSARAGGISNIIMLSVRAGLHDVWQQPKPFCRSDFSTDLLSRDTRSISSNRHRPPARHGNERC